MNDEELKVVITAHSLLLAEMLTRVAVMASALTRFSGTPQSLQDVIDHIRSNCADTAALFLSSDNSFSNVAGARLQAEIEKLLTLASPQARA